MLQVCYKTDRGMVRPRNEDAVLVMELGPFYVLAVADGLGGHASGEVASRIAVDQIEQHLTESYGRGELPDKEAVVAAIAAANTRIRRVAEENPASQGMGSTLVTALVWGGKVLLANIGDSRAYRVGQGITRLTRDHSLVQEMVQHGLITEEDARGHPHRHVVTRALGMAETVSPDFYDIDLGDSTLLLCSDGLTDALGDSEIAGIVTGASSIEESCAQLVAAANAAGGRDNVTVILARPIA